MITFNRVEFTGIAILMVVLGIAIGMCIQVQREIVRRINERKEGDLREQFKNEIAGYIHDMFERRVSALEECFSNKKE